MLTPEDGGTRVHLRLRLAPVKHERIAEVGGGLFDALTIAGMAAGLRERLAEHAQELDPPRRRNRTSARKNRRLSGRRTERDTGRHARATAHLRVGGDGSGSAPTAYAGGAGAR